MSFLQLRQLIFSLEGVITILVTSAVEFTNFKCGSEWRCWDQSCFANHVYTVGDLAVTFSDVERLGRAVEVPSQALQRCFNALLVLLPDLLKLLTIVVVQLVRSHLVSGQRVSDGLDCILESTETLKYLLRHSVIQSKRCKASVWLGWRLGRFLLWHLVDLDALWFLNRFRLFLDPVFE